MPAKQEEIPETIRRSPKKVQRTYMKALDNAHEQYDSEERAHRTAYAAVKHIARKAGDRWELKEKPGPSDPQAKQGGSQARRNERKTAGGIDVEGGSKEYLYERAKELNIEGRSKMNKKQLAAAIRRKV